MKALAVIVTQGIVMRIDRDHIVVFGILFLILWVFGGFFLELLIGMFWIVASLLVVILAMLGALIELFGVVLIAFVYIVAVALKSIYATFLAITRKRER